MSLSKSWIINRLVVDENFAPKIKITPHIIWTNNFKNGLVLYASSAKPIKKAKDDAVSKAIDWESLNSVLLSKKIPKQAVDKRKEM